MGVFTARDYDGPLHLPTSKLHDCRSQLRGRNSVDTCGNDAEFGRGEHPGWLHMGCDPGATASAAVATWVLGVRL